MTCVGDYEINPPIYKTTMKKSNNLHTDDMLDDNFMYLYYGFQSTFNTYPIFTF
jgi:hypothetical protein